MRYSTVNENCCHASGDLYSAAKKPVPIPNFKIKRDVLEHLPERHRLAAELAIKKGKWILVEDD
jgi:hypothetical protein